MNYFYLLFNTHILYGHYKLDSGGQ